MDLGIRGRKAIVAGASAGLGKSSALALAREGVEVVISARNQDRLVAALEYLAPQTQLRLLLFAQGDIANHHHYFVLLAQNDARLPGTQFFLGLRPFKFRRARALVRTSSSSTA